MASRQRTGVAAILAGALIFAGQGGELVFDDTAGGLWVTLGIGGSSRSPSRSGACASSSARHGWGA